MAFLNGTVQISGEDFLYNWNPSPKCKECYGRGTSGINRTKKIVAICGCIGKQVVIEYKKWMNDIKTEGDAFLGQPETLRKLKEFEGGSQCSSTALELVQDDVQRTSQRHFPQKAPELSLLDQK